ncbi:MAG: hypothetical protein JW904_11730 [Spirochaetales bacterium]|nr:hypothetical protein [Spirochaetales bacterium]
MTGFLLKKTFFDMWDNLYGIIILNLGFYIVFAATFGMSYLTIIGLSVFIPQDNIFGGFSAMMIIMIFVHCFYNVYAGAVSGVTKDIAYYQPPTFAAFFQYLKETWKTSLGYGLLQGVISGIFVNAALFYLNNMNDQLNAIIFFIIVEVYVIWLIASQYFLTIQSNFDKKVPKNLKKMFLLLLDNTAFTIFGLTLISILFFTISVFTFFLVPGFVTILLLQSVALKLRMYKYEYLEANPEANRKKIPWETLLLEEKDKVGKRTFKGMIFPWKD